ncbi:MAG: hypothetical protein ACXQT2_00635, partial [Methanotrichaceae archaeon]
MLLHKVPTKVTHVFYSISGRNNRILKDFPDLEEWRGDPLWVPTALSGVVGTLLKSIFQLIIHASIAGDNPESTIYRLQASYICAGYTVT